MYLKPINKNSEESEKPLSLSNNARVFFDQYLAAGKNEAGDNEDFKINVDTVSMQVASLYENIRKVVDWKEEHLMRRIAIERILKRRLFLKRKIEETAEDLLVELVRGGHFPNNFISRSRIEAVQILLERYYQRLHHLPASQQDKTKTETYSLLFKIAACELEDLLDPQSYTHISATIAFMEKIMLAKIVIGQEAKEKYPLNSNDKEILTYIAVQQALFRLDRPIIIYNILKRYSPEWFSTKTEISEAVTVSIYKIFKNIDTRFNHPLAHKFFTACQNYSAPFLVLNDVMQNDSQNLLSNSMNSKSVIKICRQAYDNRLKFLKARLTRSAIYATISVFLTHIILLYVLEIPLAKLITGQLNFVAMAVDILVPTILMGVLVAGIKLPSDENFDLISQELQKILYKNNELGFYEIEIYRQKSWFIKAILRLWYGISFIVCFGILIGLMYWAKFPITSYFVFTIFTSIILFTGSVLRKNSQELNIQTRKDGLFSSVAQPLVFPIVYLGRWLSGKWQKYNLAGIFFSILIDSPFAVFLNFIEQWRHFVQEKEEEIH